MLHYAYVTKHQMFILYSTSVLHWPPLYWCHAIYKRASEILAANEYRDMLGTYVVYVYTHSGLQQDIFILLSCHIPWNKRNSKCRRKQKLVDLAADPAFASAGSVIDAVKNTGRRINNRKRVEVFTKSFLALRRGIRVTIRDINSEPIFVDVTTQLE